MSTHRERCEVVGTSRELGRTIEDLRSVGFRRVAGEPRRVGQYFSEPVAGRAHVHRLVWLAIAKRRRPAEASSC